MTFSYWCLFVCPKQKLPPDLNLQELEEYRDKLKRQQAAVSINFWDQCYKQTAHLWFGLTFMCWIITETPSSYLILRHVKVCYHVYLFHGPRFGMSVHAGVIRSSLLPPSLSNVFWSVILSLWFIVNACVHTAVLSALCMMKDATHGFPWETPDDPAWRYLFWPDTCRPFSGSTLPRGSPRGPRHQLAIPGRDRQLQAVKEELSVWRTSRWMPLL